MALKLGSFAPKVFRKSPQSVFHVRRSNMLLFLEGIDGSGKSSVVQELTSKYFTDAKKLRLPTDRLRERLTEKSGIVATAYDIISDHCNAIVEEIVPALLEGKDVIVDRSWLSAVIYQGESIREFVKDDVVVDRFIRSIYEAIFLAFCSGFAGHEEELEELDGLEQPMIFILSISPEEARRRAEARDALDQFEDASMETWIRRNEEYKRLAREEDPLNFERHLIEVYGKTPEQIAEVIYGVCCEVRGREAAC